jgi:hypothetical protein
MILAAARPPRGYALPLVLGMSLILAGALGAALSSVAGSVRNGESLLHRRQALHAAEGVATAALELATERLRTLPLRPALPDSDPGYAAALAALLASNRTTTTTFLNSAAVLAEITPEGYTLVPDAAGLRIELSGLGAPAMRELAAGPFRGMLAMVQPMSLRVSLRRDHDRTPALQVVQTNVERATISMFQFYVFSDVYLDLDPGGTVDARGRIHTNGDFCVAGEPRIDRVTAAGDILMSNKDDHRCRRRAGERNDIRVATDDGFTTFATMTKDNDAADWVSYADTTLAGHAQDSAHGVQALRMPLSGQPRVQAGANVLAMEQTTGAADDSLLQPIAQAREDNTASMRFLVDPMLIDEPNDVREQKFAFKADIRIIDGVWFLRRPENPHDIGIPIWSDHPGTGTEDYDDNEADVIRTAVVGQDTIRAEQSWGPTPSGFSYYGFEPDPSTPGSLRWARSSASPRATISYGLLHNAGGNVWNPGRYATAPTATSSGTTAEATTLDEFLLGARSGFKDGWLETRSETAAAPPGSGDPGNSDTEARRARMLPINFDVAGFLQALQSCAPGQNELGSYFRATCTGSSAERRFNGVVYVSSTWPGSMDGLGTTSATSGFARLSPFHGTDASGNPLAANPALPMPLCAPAATAPTLSGTALSTTLSRCAQLRRSSDPARRSFPNVLRIFNAQHINPRSNTTYAGVTIRAGVLPDGLTIATNLPVVAMGDMNLDTTPRRLRTDPVPSPDHFVPFLIAGDRFYRFSRAWNDALANWVQPMNENVRSAVETTQFTEILAGWNPTPATPLAGHNHSSDGFEDFPRYLECWGDANPVHYAGSIVVAFASVYTRSGANNGDGDINVPSGRTFAACFPGRDEGYDLHLEDPENQPPGAPQILAQSVLSWTAR